MEIKHVFTNQLKFDKELVKVGHSVSVEVPVIVDKELNVIFGDATAMKKSELDVIVFDLPFKETRLAMHSIGKWAEPNWKQLKSEEPPKYGYTAFIDDFLFKEVQRHLGTERTPDHKPADFGDLF